MAARDASLILAALFTLCLTASAQDHLEPERGMLNQPEWQWESAQRLREVLLKDAASYHLVRMVCLPAFEREWVVTVVREEPKDLDGPHAYYVECVVAERKLFPPKDSRGVTAKKARAPVDRDTAESLNQIWRRMLRTTRYPREPRLGADGVDYHFSRFLPLVDCGRADPLAGWEQGTIWSPDEASFCGELVAIGERLKAYAQARPEDREGIRREIRERADMLGARLDRAQSENPKTGTMRENRDTTRKPGQTRKPGHNAKTGT
jgi:hypothetical protein